MTRLCIKIYREIFVQTVKTQGSVLYLQHYILQVLQFLGFASWHYQTFSFPFIHLFSIVTRLRFCEKSSTVCCPSQAKCVALIYLCCFFFSCVDMSLHLSVVLTPVHYPNAVLHENLQTDSDGDPSLSIQNGFMIFVWPDILHNAGHWSTFPLHELQPVTVSWGRISPPQVALHSPQTRAALTRGSAALDAAPTTAMWLFVQPNGPQLNADSDGEETFTSGQETLQSAWCHAHHVHTNTHRPVTINTFSADTGLMLSVDPFMRRTCSSSLWLFHTLLWD